MTEKTKLEHIRNNKDVNIDYIKIYNQGLTQTKIVPLAQMRYADNMLLGQVIASLGNEIKVLKETIATLQEQVKNVEKVNLEIIKGKLSL